MRGQRTFVLAVVAGGVIAFVVSEVRGHDFHLLALPGIHLAMALTEQCATDWACGGVLRELDFLFCGFGFGVVDCEKGSGAQAWLSRTFSGWRKNFWR